MNLTLKKRMPSLMTDWFVPRSILSPEFFDMDSSLLPFQSGVNLPSVNIQETPKEFKLELAAPGLERKDFKIEVENHTLTISAEKMEEKKEEKIDYSRKEFSFTSFCRSFTLPEEVKEGNIDAKYENGILYLLIPKKEVTATKPVKQIQVH
jgi:HSP20 family protein